MRQRMKVAENKTAFIEFLEKKTKISAGKLCKNFEDRIMFSVIRIWHKKVFSSAKITKKAQIAKLTIYALFEPRQNGDPSPFPSIYSSYKKYCKLDDIFIICRFCNFGKNLQVSGQNQNVTGKIHEDSASIRSLTRFARSPLKK